MKLARFSARGKEPVLGVVSGDRIAAIRDHVGAAPDDMIDLIKRWDELRDQIAAISTFDHAVADVTLHAPIKRPGKIMGIGFNYADHAAEAGIEPPSEQMWFSKASTAANGPFDPIQRPAVSTALDYEAEMVAIIGKGGRHLAGDDASAAIFGYCVGNDVSARDWQAKTSQFVLGKSFDSHAPFGPWIVTADEVDAGNLEISAFVNGERRQHSNTHNLIFKCRDQVELLSQVMTLEPGDVLFTGTPNGVGAAMKPPVWLKAGDVVRIEIEKLGAIESVVVDEVVPAKG